VTDQTSAHDPLNGYVPAVFTLEEAGKLRRTNPDAYIAESMQSMKLHVEAMLALKHAEPLSSTTATTYASRRLTPDGGKGFEILGFVPEYIGPFSVRAKDRFVGWRCPGIRAIFRRQMIWRLTVPGGPDSDRWLRLARDRIHFQGLPARICWLGMASAQKWARPSMNSLSVVI